MGNPLVLPPGMRLASPGVGTTIAEDTATPISWVLDTYSGRTKTRRQTSKIDFAVSSGSFRSVLVRKDSLEWALGLAFDGERSIVLEGDVVI